MTIVISQSTSHTLQCYIQPSLGFNDHDDHDGYRTVTFQLNSSRQRVRDKVFTYFVDIRQSMSLQIQLKIRINPFQRSCHVDSFSKLITPRNAQISTNFDEGKPQIKPTSPPCCLDWQRLIYSRGISFRHRSKTLIKSSYNG